MSRWRPTPKTHRKDQEKTNMTEAQRKSIDCREYPSESGCTLRIEGAEDEVLDAAVNHAVAKHGHPNTAELRDEIRKLLKNA
jgi:uncharacterized protein DUF1059